MIKSIRFYARATQFWVGIMYNSSFKILYIQPLPMLGIRIALKLVV